MAPIPHLQTMIANNLMPPDHIIPQVINEMARFDTLINTEENKLKDIGNTLTLLIKQQTLSQNKIDNYRVKNLRLASLLAPYRKTPPEIISQIFQWLIPTPSSDINEWLTTINTFTHVSKHWHNIAISNIHLWKKLDLQISPDNVFLATQLLQRWLSNMRTDNLHLTINKYRHIAASYKLQNLYQSLHCCTRLKRLDILITHPYPQVYLILLKDISFPTLQKLHIEGNTALYHGISSMATHIIAPKLTGMTLKSFRPAHVFPKDNLRNLTKLAMDLNTYTLVEHLKLLGECPSLTDCHIALNHTIHANEHLLIQDIILPHLNTLSVEMHILLSKLLSKLITPSLTALHIYKNGGAHLKVCDIIPYIQETRSIQRIKITGFNVTRERNKFLQQIHTTHSHTNTLWFDTDPWSTPSRKNPFGDYPSHGIPSSQIDIYSDFPSDMSERGSDD